MPPLRNILVATDLSRNASHAVSRAALLAIEHEAALHLVHAHQPVPADTLARMGIGRRTAEQVEVAVRDHLDSVASTLRSQGIVVSTRIIKGGPLSAIRKSIGSCAADLVVIGARGERSLRNTLLGTTAQRLLDFVPRNILAVASAPRGAYANIQICVDNDRQAASVLTTAARMFPGARRNVVHAYEPLFEEKLRFGGASDSTIREHREYSKGAAQQLMVEVLRRSGVETSPRSLVLRKGYPPQVILDVARRRDVELIVMGRGRTPISEFFLGSVSKQVLQQANRDVAVLGRNSE